MIYQELQYILNNTGLIMQDYFYMGEKKILKKCDYNIILIHIP